MYKSRYTNLCVDSKYPISIIRLQVLKLC